MLTAKLAKSIIAKSLFTKAIHSVSSTSNQQRSSQQNQNPFRQRRPQRQLKPYEKLFFSSPIMNINIEMIMAINQLRPKATYIIATKNGQFPKQISNSTFNIIECLNYIQGFKYFYKSFPALMENFTRILQDKIEFSATGIFKPNAIKKLIQMISHVDCLHGQIFVECVSVFFIWALESSIKTKHKLTELIIPLKSRLKQVQQKRKIILESKKQSDSKTIQALDQQIYNLQNEIKKLIFKNRFMKEEDFLSALHYCLQRGYYSETIVREFVENVLEKDNFNFPDFEAFLKEEEEFFPDKPLTGIFNRRALIYCKMYSNTVYRIKILNELKRMKQFDPKFMDFIKNTKQSQQSQESESTSQDSPFINGQKIEQSTSSQSHSQQKTEHVSAKLIEQSLIPKKAYLNLVNSYLQLLENKDVLCYILSEQPSSQSFRIMQTEFFSYLNDDSNKAERILTLSDVKSKYLNVFKEIFNVQKNGLMYVESVITEGAFQVILRMFDYSDRKQIFELLKLYERYLVSRNVQNIKSLAPFYVFQKYGYKSNFVASKLFEYINFKYRGRDDTTYKEEMILNGLQICRYLCLYFKLLESTLPSLFSYYDLGTGIKPKATSTQTMKQQKQIHLKQQIEFQQAIEIFLHNYNKIISVVYLERENSGFIGKGLELSYDYIRLKFLTTKSFEQAMYMDGKVPEEDIRKIIYQHTDAIKSHRSYIKNVYQKQFLTNSAPSSKTQNPQTNQQISTDNQLNFNPYLQSMLSRRKSIVNPLDQVSIILQIVQTAIELQSLKKMEFYEDVLAVFKSIFENKKLVKILSHQQTFPQILKRMIRITQFFKGSYKNESNKLFESILNLTGFNMNSFLHTSRINIMREVMNADKSILIDEAFQPYMHVLDLNTKMQPNQRIWASPTYHITKQNVISHIRSDILHLALIQNAQSQKIIRDQLAKIKTVKPNDRVKNIKFQLNYLEYPYLANVAINKSNELIVVLVRRQTTETEKPYNATLNKYHEECEKYFKKKGNKVITVTNQYEIRNTLKELIK